MTGEPPRDPPPADQAPVNQPPADEPIATDPKPPIVPPGLDATIVLIRHGESEWVAQGLFQGQGDSPLSEIGRRQAALVARRVAQAHEPPRLPVPDGPPTAIVHSPLSRTAETASILAAALAPGDPAGAGIAMRADPGFIEIGQGEWEGVHAATVSERWADLLAGWRDDPLTAWAPGGESVAEVDARVRPAIGRLLDELAASARIVAADRSPVLGYADLPSEEPWSIVVGHDGVFKVTLLALLDLPLSRFWTFPFALCGITVVELRAGRPRLRLFNATDHLAPLETETEIARIADQERRRRGAL
jgi:broad specificity phosphatase PhoE